MRLALLYSGAIVRPPTEVTPNFSLWIYDDFVLGGVSESIRAVQVVPIIGAHCLTSHEGTHVTVLDQLGFLVDEEGNSYFAPSKEFDDLAFVVVYLGNHEATYLSRKGDAPEVIQRLDYGEKYPLSGVFVLVIREGITRFFSINEISMEKRDYEFVYDKSSGTVSFKCETGFF